MRLFTRMPISHALRAAAISIALTAASAVPAAALQLLTPAGLGLETKPGGSAFCLVGCISRSQLLYGSSNFSEAILIEEMVFRAAPGAGTFTERYSSVDITMSTTSVTPATLSKTHASNVGTSPVKVRSGALVLSSLAPSLSIVLQTPFLYDPTQGNLLVDFLNIGGESYGIGGGPFDGMFVRGIDMGAVGTTPNGGFTNVISGLGFVTTFVGESVGGRPIPEPSGAVAFAVGLLLAGAAARRSQQ